MMDRKRVIDALEYLIEGDCTDTQFDYVDEIMAAIEMLKAIPKKDVPAIRPVENPIGDAIFWHCGQCGANLSYWQQKCLYCGRLVLWE